VLVGWAASVLLAVSGCAGDTGRPDRPAGPPPGFPASLLQYSHDAVADRVVVKVANSSERPFTVERLGIDAAGFAPIGPFDFGTEVPPGRAFDLRMTYGTPDCDADTARPVALVVSFAAGGGEVRVPVEDGAQVLRRVHDSTCAARAARSAVPLSWSPAWSVTTVDGQLTAVGTLQLGPVQEGTRVQLGTFNPTTLFQISLRNPPPSIGPGQRAEVVAHVRPTRCDPHALGESPQGFEFLLRLWVARPGDTSGADGTETEALVPVPPAPEVKKLLEDYWLRRCAVATGG
jgi:hypothetical protein